MARLRPRQNDDGTWTFPTSLTAPVRAFDSYMGRLRSLGVTNRPQFRALADANPWLYSYHTALRAALVDLGQAREKDVQEMDKLYKP